MTESLEDRIRRLMAESCMTEAEKEQAKQHLEAYLDAHPEAAKRLEHLLNDPWNAQ